MTAHADPPRTPVPARYGAPMGRTERPGPATGPVRLFRVKLTDGYDHGGAYWGCGVPLYCATDGGALCLFLRSPDDLTARALVLDRAPGTSFYRIPEGAMPDIVNGYLECAEWADKPEGSAARFPADSQTRAARDCAAFVQACGPLAERALMARGYSATRFGHDFWLSRSGHGAGFFDRSELDASGLGDALQEKARAFGSVDMYAARGWLYFEGV